MTEVVGRRDADGAAGRAARARARRVPGVEARAGKFPGPSLVPALNAIQARLGWLPREELEALAREAKRPRYEIEGIVSFYPHYRTAPPPAVALHACHDLPCWLAGGDERIAQLRQRYGDDPDVELVEVSCLGRCDTAPAVAVNERPAPVDDADALVAAARSGPPSDGPHARSDRADDRAVRGAGEPWPNDPYPARSGVDDRYATLRAVLDGSLSPDTVVTILQDSGLRGMGGAGFPTGRKWELVRAEADPVKYVVCNADESEPGTFKDRQILATQPHLVLEGLLLGMAVVGAERGWVFVRHEYGPEERVLRAEIDALRGAGLVGPGREVEVFVSPGGYILGEETALLECMEGHRGEPRNKPPFPGTYGLHGRPTLINSVETFAHVPVIVQRGAAWWRDQGAGGSVGWKFFSVSGDVERPDVYCVPTGTPVGELIDLAGGVSGGRAVGSVQPGGASSNFIGPERLDMPLDFGPAAEAGTMLGSGAVVVLAEGRDLLAASTNVLRFFRDESCGKCVPCRVGSTKAHDLLDRVVGQGRSELTDAERARIVELEEAMRRTSICGLGQVALGPTVSVLGLARGGAAAREQPRPDGAATQPDR